MKHNEEIKKAIDGFHAACAALTKAGLGASIIMAKFLEASNAYQASKSSAKN